MKIGGRDDKINNEVGGDDDADMGRESDRWAEEDSMDDDNMYVDGGGILYVGEVLG